MTGGAAASAALWLLAGYLVGSVPTSLLVARAARGVDLRAFGSRNLGATNLYRLLGWKAAVPVALVDVSKGALPVLAYGWLGSGPEWWCLALGLTAVLGHVYSPFAGFRGGKGVATATGVFLAVAPLAIALSAVVWVGLVVGTGLVSLGSVLGALAFPAFLRLLYPDQGVAAWVAVALAVFIVFTHRSNVRRLLSGTEPRFGRRQGGGSGPARDKGAF